MSSAVLRGAIATSSDARCETVRTVLSPAVGELLGTQDAELFTRRLHALSVDVTDDEDREALQERLDRTRRVGWAEGLARLALAAAGACGMTVLLWLALSHLVDGLGFVTQKLPPAQRSWFAWPVPAHHLTRMVLLLALGVVLATLACWLRARTAVQTARRALQVALAERPEVWPGLPADAPFRAMAHVRGLPGSSLLLLAVAVLGWQLSGHQVAGWLLALALLAAVLGAGLLVLAVRLLRVDELVSRALFIGRI